MALAEGSRVFVCYDLPPPALWHERYVLSQCLCGQGWHIVMTPDHDIYPEQISLENQDLAGFRIGSGQGLPFGLDGTNTYRMRNLPPAAEMQQIRIDAMLLRQWGLYLVQPLLPGRWPLFNQGMLVLLLQVMATRASGWWLRLKVVERGDEVTLDGSETLQGTIGLKPDGGSWYAIKFVPTADQNKYAGREAAADARLLGVSFQGLSRVERVWRDVAKELSQEAFEDWSVPGPRTSFWCCQFLNRRNGGPTDHHKWWVTNNNLTSEMWGVVEHENLTKMLDKLGRYDGLDLSNLAGAEMAFRRLQLIEYFYSDKGPGSGKGSGKSKEKDKKSDDLSYKAEAAIFTGTHREFGDTMVCPDLLKYVSKEVERDAAVLKQVRKAREERTAAAK